MSLRSLSPADADLPEQFRDFLRRRAAELTGCALLALVLALAVALVTWSVQDPSLNHAAAGRVRNLLGAPGAVVADIVMQLIGLASIAMLAAPAFWGFRLVAHRRLDNGARRVLTYCASVACAAGLASLMPATDRWPLPTGLGGVIGDALAGLPQRFIAHTPLTGLVEGILFAAAFVLATAESLRVTKAEREAATDVDDRAASQNGDALDSGDDDRAGEPGILLVALGAGAHWVLGAKAAVGRLMARRSKRKEAAEAARAPWLAAASPFQEGGAPPARLPTSADSVRREPSFGLAATPSGASERALPDEPTLAANAAQSEKSRRVAAANAPVKPGKRAMQESQPSFLDKRAYILPPLLMLSEAKRVAGSKISEDALEQNARLLEGVLDDFGVKGEIINVRPGPVVTLYELEPAPGIKSSRVIGLADDIARSMSAISARVAVVQGRNAIGIELPNQKRETVYLRELVGSEDFEKSKHKLAIALGKTIGGEPVIVDLARMPHLLVAGTTGSGKSVAINTMILSIVYRLKPEECRLIMVDPKMLELSVYDGIPHLLTPVVTDPKKAVVALKWAVREMEDRYKKMSKVGVRNIDGFNARLAEARAKGETITRTVQTGFNRETGEAVYEHEQMDLAALPYIVVIVDEMADLMMVAGKDIEGAIQRLAQMARAAGIHLIMATQRPSVDVITGTIKANFPTRISFQVTSKIDSRTILGEQGAEQLLGQGDMLYMAGGGRISRVHGPFVSDEEVEKIVAHLKTQGQPDYLEAITADEPGPGDEEDVESAPAGSMDAEESGDLYDRAVNIVLRDRKCSTSYIQRRLSVGYNKAASLVERMEREGVVGAPNHSGKREILVGGGIDRGALELKDDE